MPRTSSPLPPRVAIIIGTTRETRFGERPARWVESVARARGDAEVEVVDLRDFPMPFFDEPASNAFVPSRDPAAQRWQRQLATFDGFVFVTPEYNRSLPAVLKNALDYAYPEWNRKPAACVGYGAVGAARAVEQLRLVCVELQMVPTRTGVHLQGADFFAATRQGRPVEEFPHLQANARAMLDELLWWTLVLRDARARAAGASGAGVADT